jgi:tetratricopeptide (TPR) repeat protein
MDRAPVREQETAMAAPTGNTALEHLKQALAARDRPATQAAVVRLLEQRAPLGLEWHRLSELMRLSGELTLALRAMDAFVASQGATPRALYAKVVLLTQAGRIQEAHELAATLPADVPDPAGRAYVLGNTAMSLGRVAQARAHLEAAVKLRPGWGPAWLTLATGTNMANDALGERLLADGPAAERHHPAELARYCYALGKLHADRREHDAAFAAFTRGAALLRGQTPYSRSGNEANARAAMTGYHSGWIEGLQAGRTSDTGRPIFVTGLPRSGTTLVEQILASHSTVADGAELNLAPHLAVQVGGVSGDDLRAYLARGGTLDALAALYLHLLQERFGPHGRIVDKSIDASRFLGLIAAVLPEAPLIWMRRDPLDNAWSCLRTFFIHGVGWSYDQADIAHHFLLEDALLSFWQQRLGARLLVVPYGELVAEPALWTARLLAHCGLADEPGVHSPHTTQRTVTTASAMQVRRPINRDGLNVAAPYRAGLQTFVDAYGAAGPPTLNGG